MGKTEKYGEPVERGRFRDNLKASAGWIAFGAALSLLLLYAGLTILTALTFGLFLYYGTRPIFHWLRGHDWGEEMSAFIALLVIALPVLVVTIMVLLSALNQASALISQADLGQMESFLRNVDLYRFLENMPSTSSFTEIVISTGFRDLLTQYWSFFSGLANTIMGFMFSVFLAFMSAFFMFVWGDDFFDMLDNVFGEHHGVLNTYLTRLDQDLATVFSGNMVNALITSILGAIVYSSMNYFASGGVFVPAPVLLGFLTGVASFIPLVGSKIVYVPATAVIMFQAFTADAPVGYGFALVFLLAAAFIVDMLPDIVLRPLLSGKSTSQGALFVSYIVGPLVFGIVGFFLMPILVVAFVNFHQVVLPGFMKEAE